MNGSGVLYVRGGVRRLRWRGDDLKRDGQVLAITRAEGLTRIRVDSRLYHNMSHTTF